ncbi:MAG: hypothetical protein HN831_03480 [Waddliaceae bacterium]|nr:hypothetical protein [Waddliaceae bacterium]
MNGTIFQITLTIWILILTAYVARIGIANNYIISMASKYASVLGTKSGEVRSKTKQARMNVENKTLLLEAVVSEVPFAARIVKYLRDQGTSDTQLFQMMTDPDALRGMKAISDSFGGLIGGVTNLLEKRQAEPKKNNKLTPYEQSIKEATG